MNIKSGIKWLLIASAAIMVIAIIGAMFTDAPSSEAGASTESAADVSTETATAAGLGVSFSKATRQLESLPWTVDGNQIRCLTETGFAMTCQGDTANLEGVNISMTEDDRLSDKMTVTRQAMVNIMGEVDADAALQRMGEISKKKFTEEYFEQGVYALALKYEESAKIITIIIVPAKKR